MESASTPEGSVCTDCGAMFNDCNFDDGPEWHQEDMSRVGSANDKSLGTLIADNNGPLSHTNNRVWGVASSTPRPTPPGITAAMNLLSQYVHLSDEMESEIKARALAATQASGRRGTTWHSAVVAAAYIELVRDVQVGDMAGEIIAHLGTTRPEFHIAQEFIVAASVGKRTLRIPSESQQEILLAHGLNKLRPLLGDHFNQVRRTARAILPKSRGLIKYDRLKIVGGVVYTACRVVFRSGMPEGLKIEAFQRAFSVSSAWITTIMKDLVDVIRQ